MLKFYYGTELEKLADKLLDELDENPLSNPLAEEVFVVQNHGIAQWLSLYMAREEGIAANLAFEFPSERLWKLIRLVDPNIPQDLPSDRGPMTWSLMELFRDEKFLTDFDNLRYYITDEDPQTQAFRSWKLSSKIADVFDQYLIYRPDLILRWGEPNPSFKSQEEQWQARLWNCLIEHWKTSYDGNWLHRAQLQKKLTKALDEKALNKDELPERISIFGVSGMPPAVVQTLVKLSKLIDVNFYQLSINPRVKKRESYENPLLRSLGKESTEFMTLLSADVKSDPEVVKDTSWKEVGGSQFQGQTVFGVIQDDLKQDRALKGRSLKVPALDASIQVHSCHSSMREVEVLYDQLLALLEENEGLRPDDILIMSPDIEAYAPMIQAVFGAPDEGQPSIPFSIADRGIKGANPAIEAFLKILKLCESRFKVTEVLDLLDVNPVQEAFGFTDDNLNQLERWIRDNRIRWGIDGCFKENLGVPASNHFTWHSGLDRMLLGYMMKPDDDKLYEGVFPYDEIETSADAGLAGKFSRFLEELFSLYRFLRNEKSPREWAKKLREIPQTFIPENRDYFREMATIRNAIEQLPEMTSLGGFTKKVPFSIIRSWLNDRLQKQSTGGGRIGRGVTFSSLMPMRSIPFKMIGIIGMNEGAFPRAKIPIEFDLLHLDPQPGDPLPSDEDRNLFLENLLSARENVYFSYVGQSNRQDTNFPPSVILKEFIDYLEEYYDLSSDDLVTKHRLQAFSPDYFKDEGLFSYSKTQQKVSSQLANGGSNLVPFMKENLPKPGEEWRQVSVNNLIEFFQYPAKFLFQKRLGLYLGEENVLDEDREPFTLTGLDSYQVGKELLERFFQDRSLDSFQQNLQARDLLPEGWSGERAFQERLQEVREFGENINSVLDQQQIDDLEVNLRIGDFRIVGKLPDVYEEARISYRFGNMRPKDVIDLWINHLCLQAVKPDNHPGISRLFTRHRKKNVMEYRLGPTSDYQQILEQLLNTYWKGLQECCYFFPESTFAYGKEVCYKGGTPESGLSKANSKWVRDYSSYPGEGADPYNKLILGSENPLKTAKFKDTAEQFWNPFFKAIIEGGK